MKNVATAFLLIITCSVMAQDISVEKSIFGIQTGLIGIWINNEARLSDKFALRSEIGLELGVIENYATDETSLAGVSSVSLEPKWYYNLTKRNAKGKRVKGNSGNSVGLKFYYYPDLFLITNIEGNIYTANQLAILPTWSLRRVYGKHFTFETGLGIGPQFFFGKEAKYLMHKQDVYGDLHLRIGYSF